MCSLEGAINSCNNLLDWKWQNNASLFHSSQKHYMHYIWIWIINHLTKQGKSIESILNIWNYMYSQMWQYSAQSLFKKLLLCTVRSNFVKMSNYHLEITLWLFRIFQVKGGNQCPPQYKEALLRDRENPFFTRCWTTMPVNFLKRLTWWPLTPLYKMSFGQ